MYYRQNWGEDLLYFYEDKNKLTSISARWTSISGEDPFIKVSAGRSLFRVSELLDLHLLIQNNKKKIKQENDSDV